MCHFREIRLSLRHNASIVRYGKGNIIPLEEDELARRTSDIWCAWTLRTPTVLSSNPAYRFCLNIPMTAKSESRCAASSMRRSVRPAVQENGDRGIHRFLDRHIYGIAGRNTYTQGYSRSVRGCQVRKPYRDKPHDYHRQEKGADRRQRRTCPTVAVIEATGRIGVCLQAVGGYGERYSSARATTIRNRPYTLI